MPKAPPVWLSEGPLPTAPPLRSVTVTLSHFPLNSGTPHSRGLAQTVPLFPGKAAGSGTSHPGSIRMPARLASPSRHRCERGPLLEVYGRCRGLLCAGVEFQPWLGVACFPNVLPQGEQFGCGRAAPGMLHKDLAGHCWMKEEPMLTDRQVSQPSGGNLSLGDNHQRSWRSGQALFSCLYSTRPQMEKLKHQQHVEEGLNLRRLTPAPALSSWRWKDPRICVWQISSIQECSQQTCSIFCFLQLHNHGITGSWNVWSSRI
ncbi:uncharacterized protein LOC115484485 [Serinus canaria]|uniref:uncharacterized protein LOC115484485 n=1 Tax=Serinus canaria TaxID=9135 RepID=UPI0021CCA8CE|nr:uncharacterized protein LOC115484485 [Serinus canaria]